MLLGIANWNEAITNWVSMAHVLMTLWNTILSPHSPVGHYWEATASAECASPLSPTIKTAASLEQRLREENSVRGANVGARLKTNYHASDTLRRAIDLASSGTSVHSVTSTENQALTLHPIVSGSTQRMRSNFWKTRCRQSTTIYLCEAHTVTQLANATNSTTDCFIQWTNCFQCHLFVHYCARRFRSEGEPRQLETAHTGRELSAVGRQWRKGVT